MEANKTKSNVLQTYISFMVFTFDILSFITITFVTVPLSRAIYPVKLVEIGLIITWGGFAASALMRPVGAAIIGPIYDRVGRKRGIELSLIGASIFTAAIGLTPTYSSVGILSPIIYIILRIIGGIFIGSLVSGGIVFATENVPERWRGFVGGFSESGGSWAHVIGALWLLMISVVFVGLSYFTIGWRVMFAVSLIPLIAVLPVIYFTPESDILILAKKKGKATEGVYKKLFSRKEIRNTFLLIMVMSLGVLGYDNLTENIFPTFLTVVNKVPHVMLSELVLYGAFFGVAGSLTGGALSQKTGRKPLAIAMSIILIVISPLFLYLGGLKASMFYLILLTLIPFYFFTAISKAVLSLLLNESFPTEVRGTAAGLNWNIGYGVAGVYPLIESIFMAIYGTKIYPLIQFIFLVILATIFLIAILMIKETKGNIAKELEELKTTV